MCFLVTNLTVTQQGDSRPERTREVRVKELRERRYTPPARDYGMNAWVEITDKHVGGGRAWPWVETRGG